MRVVGVGQLCRHELESLRSGATYVIAACIYQALCEEENLVFPKLAVVVFLSSCIDHNDVL